MTHKPFAQHKPTVLAFINDHFDTTAITVEEEDLFPCGHMITDKNGDTMIVFWDWMTQTVKCVFPD